MLKIAIVPIEAQSCGTLVITLNYGGTAEIVIDAVSGVDFKKQTKGDIIDAVKRFETMTFDSKKISLLSQEYSEDRFKKEFKLFVYTKLNQNQ